MAAASCKLQAAAQHHVVVFPWPEQGHINTATGIAHFIAASGIHVTFVHTERSYSLMQEASSLLHMIDAGTHQPTLCVEVVPDCGVQSGHAATRAGLDSLLSKLMQCHPQPSCLVVDSFFPWTHTVAARHGLARVEFWNTSACAFTAGLHVPDLINKGYLPVTNPGCLEKVVDFIPGLTPFQMADLPIILATSNIEDPVFKFFSSVVEYSKHADRVLANTVYEVEGSTIELLKENAGIRMDPIGPLPNADRHSLLPEDPTCMSWLDKQEKGSVLYVAFGSVSVLKEEVLVELAYGLVASEQPFLWVIRPSKDSNASAANPQEGKLLHEALNVVRKQGKGFVTSWAPQIAILGHVALGAFLSHCGWNSTMESLYRGVPIIGFPQGGDQPLYLKYIVDDWKAGLTLLKADKKGELRRDHVEKVVRAMMVGEEGRQAREDALNWSKLANKAFLGSSSNNLTRFVDDIKQGLLKISALD